MDAANMKLKHESSASSNGSSQGTAETVEEFMERHLVREQRGKADLPMKDLRHIIPLLVMHCFGIKEEPGQKKVKGMWTDKPNGWPLGVPYCDPNNAMKGEGKPRKETLMQMFNFLTLTYKTQIGNSSPSTMMPVEKVSQSYALSSPGYTLPAVADHPLSLSTAPLSSSPVSSSTTPSPANSHTILVETTPMEITHSADIEMPNPGTAILERIDQKVRYIWQRKLTDDSDVALLHIIQDLLNKMCALKDKEVVLFYTSTHEFECTLDLVIELGRMPEEYRVKWKEFEEMWKPSLGSTSGVMQIYDLQGAPEVAEEVEIQQDESTDQPMTAVPSNNISLQPNEPNVTYVNEGSITQLGIRTLTIGTIDDLQANGLLDVRVLSDSSRGPGFSAGELQDVTAKGLEVVHGKVIVNRNSEIEEGMKMAHELMDMEQQNQTSIENGKEEEISVKETGHINEKECLIKSNEEDAIPAYLVTQSHEIIATPEGIEPNGQLNEAHIADAVRSMNLKSPPRERRREVVDNAVVMPVNPLNYPSQSQAYQFYEPISPATESPSKFPHYWTKSSSDPPSESRGNTIRELLMEGAEKSVGETYPAPVDNKLENRKSASDSVYQQNRSPQIENDVETEPDEIAPVIQEMESVDRPQSFSENSQDNENALPQDDENTCLPQPGGEEGAIEDEGPPSDDRPVVITVNLQQIIGILRDPTHPGHGAVSRTLAGTHLGNQLQAMLSGNLPLAFNQEDIPENMESKPQEPGAPLPPPVQAPEEDIPTVVCDMESKKEYTPPSKKKKVPTATLR